MTETEIARQLFACAAIASNSEHKRLHLIELPSIVLTLAKEIVEERYKPRALTVFAVSDPKLREIFAPDFADRLVQHWLVQHIEPWFNRRFIDDSFANRKGKGVQAAVVRLQGFLRQPPHVYYLKLDIRAFFPSIHRTTLLGLWHKALLHLPFDAITLAQLDKVATAILMQNPLNPPPIMSGDRGLLAQVPRNKSLLHTSPGVGLPIGSLTSQFFANVYLNELDQFIKHKLHVRGYLRYVDDFVLLGQSITELQTYQAQIADFLQSRLQLQLHPHKIVLQRSNQGIHYLGTIIYPHYRLCRQRTVRALYRRLNSFFLLFQSAHHPGHDKAMYLNNINGSWKRWLQCHTSFFPNGDPSPALLTRILSTINSYYGILQHARTYTLRKHIYHRRLGILQRYFLPDNAAYTHLSIRKVWLKQHDDI